MRIAARQPQPPAHRKKSTSALTVMQTSKFFRCNTYKGPAYVLQTKDLHATYVLT
jgi:hypothetical protein